MPSPRDLIVWENVEELLREKGLKRTDLATRMGISPQAVNSIRTNGIGAKSIKNLAAALGVDELRLVSVPGLPVSADPLLAEKCRKVKVIIESKTSYAGALKENIDAFYKAVEAEKESRQDIASLKKEMISLRQEIGSLRSQQQNHKNHIEEAGPASPIVTVRGDGS